MIKGKNVGLRSIEKDDLNKLKNWRNIEEFRKNFRESRELSNLDQEKWLEYLHDTKQINFMFSIIDLKSKTLIGACGLLYVDWIIRSADFSFYLGENETYIGDDKYSVESVKLLINYGFNNLNLNKIWMELYEFDSKKINFFINNFAFKKDGKLRDNCFENGKFWDSYIISLTKKDFRILNK